MNKAVSFDQPTVQAIHVTTEQQRRAFRVVDAVDELHNQLGALRAVQQLTTNDKAGSLENLPQLQRGDLATLLSWSALSLKPIAPRPAKRQRGQPKATNRHHARPGRFPEPRKANTVKRFTKI
ncbi:hypothetical protein [Polaromonas sp. UC242_47]|uniref:hypothetical protein n=1 Tax=Polaromonas sp. UC242_47 TaxID=3374626 RepID=UPI0037983A01